MVFAEFDSEIISGCRVSLVQAIKPRLELRQQDSGALGSKGFEIVAQK